MTQIEAATDAGTQIHNCCPAGQTNINIFNILRNTSGAIEGLQEFLTDNNTIAQFQDNEDFQ